MPPIQKKKKKKFTETFTVIIQFGNMEPNKEFCMASGYRIRRFLGQKQKGFTNKILCNSFCKIVDTLVCVNASDQ